MTNVQLDFAIEQFKSVQKLVKQNKSNDWKKAYLNRINIKQSSLNRSAK